MEEKSFTHGVTLHKDGTYALQLNIDFGYMTPDDLITLGGIAKKYGVTCCAATTAKKISLMNVKEEDVNKVWAEVDEAFGERLYYPHGKVVLCPSNDFCKFAMAGKDNRPIGKKVVDISLTHNAGKIKVGISSCPRCCAMSKTKDIGIFAMPNGWSVLVGGNAGGNAAMAQPVAEKLSDDELFALLEKIYQYFEDNRQGKERTVLTLKRLGFDHFKKNVLGE